MAYEGVRLVLGTPSQHGDVWSGYSNAVAWLHTKCCLNNIGLALGQISGSCYVEQVRNKIANSAMVSGATHLFFWDSDIGAQPDYVFHMLEFMKGSKYSIMGANYPKKEIDWNAVFEAVKNGATAEQLPLIASPETVGYLGDKRPEKVDEPFEVAKIATGFMMIKRSVFELFQKKYPQKKLKDGSYLYFSNQVIAGEWTGEDFSFCRDMRNAGEKIWLCPWMDLSHHGAHTFGNPFLGKL